MATHNHHQQNHGLENSQVVVVMVPFPAQGHLNQLLHLSRLIASYNIPVHYVSSATHILQAKHRIHTGNHLFDIPNVHFHDFPTPSFLSPPPNPNASIKFPSHLQPSFEASSQLREPVTNLLRELSPKSRRIIVIHDSLMASVVQDVASIPNAESYNFHSVSAFALFCHRWETMGRPFQVEANILKDLPSNEGCFTSEFIKFINTQFDHIQISSGRLYNTCRVMESPYLDLLANEVPKNTKQWALGPFNPVAVSHNKKSYHPCLDWLDKQPQNSVIYVSFGTTTSFSDEQIKELAAGLERSEQKFIWVLRDADRGDVFEGAGERKLVEVLPKGFEERVEGKGIVVREWAPQLEILGHTSTGGFMSHCGWNSCMESITMGVAIGAWPMHSDQPKNTVLMTKVLKVGVVVKDWARRDELVDSLTIETAVKTLMGSKEGEEIRKRAAELGQEVRQAVEEGGVSRLELDSFISHITRSSYIRITR